MKIPIKKKKASKRHFQLLELMVAVVILLLCVTPSMQVLTNIFKSQQEIVRENQKDHIAHLLHAKYTEMLYKRMISFEDIRGGNEIAVNDQEILDQLKANQFDCKGVFTIIKSSKPRDAEVPTKYLCKLEVHVKDRLAKNDCACDCDCQADVYENYLFIDTEPNEGKEDEEQDDEEDPEPEENQDEGDEEDEGDDDEFDDVDRFRKRGPGRAEAQVGQGMQR